MVLGARYPFFQNELLCNTCAVFPWITLSLSALLLVGCAYILRLLLALTRLRKEHLAVLASGLPASGTILKLEKTGRSEGTRAFPILELRLDVEVSLKERSPYTVQTRQLVDAYRVAMVQPGQQIGLRVDAKEPQRIVVIDAASASEPGTAKPLFDPRRSRASLIAVSVASAIALGNFTFMLSVQNWGMFFPPPDGFCAAAVRCCNLAPPEPMVDPALIQHLNLQIEPCSLDPDASEATCQFMYEGYRANAKKLGLSCE